MSRKEVNVVELHALFHLAIAMETTLRSYFFWERKNGVFSFSYKGVVVLRTDRLNVFYRYTAESKRCDYTNNQGIAVNVMKSESSVIVRVD